MGGLDYIDMKSNEMAYGSHYQIDFDNIIVAHSYSISKTANKIRFLNQLKNRVLK